MNEYIGKAVTGEMKKVDESDILKYFDVGFTNFEEFVNKLTFDDMKVLALNYTICMHQYDNVKMNDLLYVMSERDIEDMFREEYNRKMKAWTYTYKIRHNNAEWKREELKRMAEVEEKINNIKKKFSV